MDHRRILASAIADAFAAGAWTPVGMAARGRRAIRADGASGWMARLAKRVSRRLAEPPRDLVELAALIDADPGFSRAYGRAAIDEVGGPMTLGIWSVPEAAAAAPTVPTLWEPPSLATSRDLAVWLGVGPARLSWLADCRGLERDAEPGLQRYRYRWLTKPSGGARLVEAPGPLLRKAQRRVLRDVLESLAPHDAAHGFRRGRSVLTFVAPHVGAHVVIRIDLRDFFASIRAARVEALFCTLGYPRPVARLFTGLCTNRAPAALWSELPPARDPAEARVRHAQRRRHRDRHLPAGAPTSPALANLIAFRLDRHLAAAARAAGVAYTRYADDLAFSGGEELARSSRRFVAMVSRIAAAEGFEVRADKLRVMRRGARQRLAGVVVNDRPAVARADVERLEATLFNCVRHGPEGQNRAGVADFRAHLTGRVGWVEHVHPARAARLRDLLTRIAWPPADVPAP